MNESGIFPQEYNCLVKPLIVEEKTKGGLYLPDDVKKKDENAQTRGLLVGISPMAFANPDMPKGARTPIVGDTISYARYAGASSRITGKDGVDYIILKDNDITAIIED